MKYLVLILIAVLVIPGCSLFNTGPKVADRVAEIAQGAAQTLLTTYKPSSTSMALNGSVNDPRYRVQTFVGAGTYVDILMSLEGADVGWNMNSSGTGVETDKEFRDAAVAIIGRGDLSEQERKDAMTAAVSAWLARQQK
jgi:hypothetical protein